MEDALMEHYRNLLGVTKEQEDEMVEKLKQASPLTALQTNNDQLKKRVEYTEEALTILMDLGMI